MRHPWRGLEGLPRGVWVLSATTLVNRLGTMALPFLVLYLTRFLGFSAAQAGSVVATYGVAAIASGPLAGRLCDRIGTIRVLRASLLLSGLVMLVYPLARTRTAIFVLTIVWAFTNEAFRPANLSLFAELAGPAQRRAAFALARLAINLGMSVGPAVGGFLAMVSFPSIFLVDGATSILAGATLMFWSRHLQAAGAPPGPIAIEPDRSPSGAWRAFTDRRLIFFLAGFLPVLLVFFQHTAAMPLFMVRDLRLPESDFGLLFSVNTVLILLLEVPLNLRMAGWPHGRSLALGAFLVGAGFGGLAFCGGFLGVAATVVIWTFGEMILLPGSSAYAADIAPAGRRGSTMGLYTMSFSVAFALGPWLGTTALDRHGPAAVWGGAFLLGCLSAAMLLRVPSAPVPALRAVEDLQSPPAQDPI